jgi:hypothetical protein
MTPQELSQIDAAVAAHGQWITRLRRAIEDHASEITPQAARVDNQCAFGKWLYGSFPAGLRDTPAFEEIRRAHAEFHVKAAAILELAVAGKRADAERLMAPSGEFMMLSGGLALKLNALKRR